LDKWEETMRKMGRMLEGERRKQIDEAMGMCICPQCPTYAGTGEENVYFCGTSKSTVINEEEGCTCGICPVVERMGLTRLYYCTRGSEAQQRGVEM